MIMGALLDKTVPRHSLACYLDLPFQMDPFYQNPSPCFHPLQADHGDPISSLTYSTSSCSASSFVHCFNLNHKIEGMEEHQDQVLDHDYKQEDDQLSLSRNTNSEDHQTQIINHSNSFKPLIHESRGHGVVDGGKQYNSTGLHVKWMSSKMRLVKKMLSTDHQTASRAIFTNNEHASRTRQRSPVQDHDDSNGNSPNKLRVCSDCSTTKTPLWRSGPQGPKSLCNACGIRRRKARRAMAAAAANGELLIKEKRPSCTGSSDHKMTQYKKRSKLGSQRSKKKINFEEFKMSLSKTSAFQQVFPQEYEIKEAAILLMALSCGLAQG